LEPMNAAVQFWYYYTSSVITTAAPTWNGAANTKAWQINAPTYEGVIGRLRTPFSDYASGPIYSYIWWVANAALASTFYMRSAVQMHVLPGSVLGENYQFNYGNAVSSTYISETTVQHQLRRTAGISIPVAYLTEALDIEYLAYWYNSAGAEDINILGVEFMYEGYV